MIRQGIPRENPVFNRSPIDEVFLHESRDALGRQPGIVRAFGIDDGNGPTLADAETLHLGAVASRRTRREREVPPFQFVFEGDPGTFPFLARATRLADAEKHVPVVMADQKLVGEFAEGSEVHPVTLVRPTR